MFYTYTHIHTSIRVHSRINDALIYRFILVSKLVFSVSTKKKSCDRFLKKFVFQHANCMRSFVRYFNGLEIRAFCRWGLPNVFKAKTKT